MKILCFGKYWAQEIIALRKTKKIRSKPIISILEAYQAFSKKEVQNTGKQKTNTSKHLKKNKSQNTWPGVKTTINTHSVNYT